MIPEGKVIAYIVTCSFCGEEIRIPSAPNPDDKKIDEFKYLISEDYEDSYSARPAIVRYLRRV